MNGTGEYRKDTFVWSQTVERSKTGQFLQLN